ncbi:bifunctional nuclease domain-containing protein [Owenweeksia hongkongensis]|uniref:bifunctional nuclease domain-containing protein n=1 Tax=Owenweeksia hongkongensis TaxID=253245 RepID=UPI003A8E0DF0
MDRVRLHIKGLSYSQTQSGAYALVLGEEDGERRLPIIIGGFEAQSIAIALEKGVNPPRPLTHDLFKNFADVFQIKLKEVIIHKLQDGVFFSILVCESNGQEQVLDARTSDAVALAIRFDCPVFTYKDILDKAGIILKEGQGTGKAPSAPKSTIQTEEAASETTPAPKSTSDLKSKNSDQLHKMMDEAVNNEDYELAARIRDEIDRRSAN